MQNAKMSIAGAQNASVAAPSALPLLMLDRVTIALSVDGREIAAVEDVSLSIARGEIMALVGESGCGKSLTSLAIMGLLPRQTARIASGAIFLRDRDDAQMDLVQLTDRQIRQMRGDVVAMIFQEPMSSLNPLERIGYQIVEALRAHRSVSWAEGRRLAIDLLAGVGLPDPERKLDIYPSGMSGGMRQRVMIAMALACKPKLLIADEPTTALDVTVQAQILDLIRDLRSDYSLGVLFITHDLGVVAEIADRVSVMYAGQIVESGSVRDVLKRPRHPYTRALLNSVPRLDHCGGPLQTIPGMVPDLKRRPQGCRFHPRCSAAKVGICDITPPILETAEAGHDVRCFRWRDLDCA